MAGREDEAEEIAPDPLADRVRGGPQRVGPHLVRVGLPIFALVIKGCRAWLQVPRQPAAARTG